MLKLVNNDLTDHHTLRLHSRCQQLWSLQNEDDFLPWFKARSSDLSAPFFIGGGSNLVLPKFLPRDVVLVQTKGIAVLKQSQQVLVTAAAGEDWHDFVVFCCQRSFSGLENLALIPGTVGACPVQNIGAYGVEVADRIAWVDAIHLPSAANHRLYPEECQFGYRDSRFKREAGQWLITRVTFRLDLVFQPVLNYAPLKDVQFEHPLQLAEHVAAIRVSKLPDPDKIANAGSFFKNPIVSSGQAEALRQRFPAMPMFNLGSGQAKLAAGWLIDQAGLKGLHDSQGLGTHTEQALVLVNRGRTASKTELLSLSRYIKACVQAKFGVLLEEEPVHPE